jgi:hypothetical protein
MKSVRRTRLKYETVGVAKLGRGSIIQRNRSAYVSLATFDRVALKDGKVVPRSPGPRRSMAI